MGSRKKHKRIIPHSFILLWISFVAAQIIYIIAGIGYESAIMSISIISILIVGVEQILISRVLLSLNKDRAIFINSLLGVFVGIALNILFISYLKSIGSAIVLIASESIVLLSASYFARKYFEIKVIVKKIIINILLSIPALFVCVMCYIYIDYHPFILLSIGVIFILLYFFIMQYSVIRNTFVVEFINKMNKRMR